MFGFVRFNSKRERLGTVHKMNENNPDEAVSQASTTVVLHMSMPPEQHCRKKGSATDYPQERVDQTYA